MIERNQAYVKIFLYQLFEDEIPQHEEEFVEMKTYITETRHPGLISYATQSELERSCRQVEKRRADVDKQLKESHSRLRFVSASLYTAGSISNLYNLILKCLRNDVCCRGL